MALNRDEVKKRIGQIKTREDRRTLVEALAETSDKEERAAIRKIFSELEKDAEGGPSGGSVSKSSESTVIDSLFGN